MAVFQSWAEAPLPAYAALIPLAAAGVIAVCAIAARRKDAVGGWTLAWAAVPCAAALLLAVWCVVGLMRANWDALALGCVPLALAGGAICLREVAHARLARAVEGLFPRAQTAALLGRDACALILAAVFTLLAMEVAFNPLFPNLTPRRILLNLVLIGCVLGALYFLGQRRGSVACAGVAVFTILGIVEYFIDVFKHTALMPSDLLAVRTAMAVAGGYEYFFSPGIPFALGFACCAVAALSFVVPTWRRRPGRAWRAVTNVAAAAVLVVCFVMAVTVPDYQKTFNYQMDYWELRTNHNNQGFLIAFIGAAQDMAIDVPEGYSDALADELLEDYAAEYEARTTPEREARQAQFASEQPTVIAVMNETYADLSIFGGLQAGYEPTYVNSGIEGQIAHGPLDVSVLGGGTCNSEFEFLTGGMMGFVGASGYPYQTFNFYDINGLARYFGDLGYHTTALHPNLAPNWDRERVFMEMTFEDTYWIEDFADCDRFHGLPSDAATYDKVLDVLASDDGPQFILDITMQNHSGYNTGTIAPEDLTDYAADYLDDDLNAQLNEYLSCIKRSDADLQAFLAELSALDRPVAVVFFGDHQPSLSRDVNDALFTGEDEMEHNARIYQTCYFVWTNYDVAGGGPTGAAVEDFRTSASYLGALALDAIGAPLDDYRAAQMVLKESVPSVTGGGFRGADGVWYAHGDVDSPFYDAYHDLAIIHYRRIVENSSSLL